MRVWTNKMRENHRRDYDIVLRINEMISICINLEDIKIYNNQ